MSGEENNVSSLGVVLQRFLEGLIWSASLRGGGGGTVDAL